MSDFFWDWIFPVGLGVLTAIVFCIYWCWDDYADLNRGDTEAP